VPSGQIEQDYTATVSSADDTASQTVTVGASVPDSADLYAHYDATALTASDGDTISSWADETGNGRAVSGSDPTYKTSQINGKPVVRFDGAGDELSVNWGSISQPITVFIVAEFQSVSGSDVERIWGTASTPSHLLGNNNGGSYRLFAGSSLSSNATPDTSTHIFGTLSDGSSSIFRLDGAQDASGGAGTNGMDSFRLGAGVDLNYANVDIGEVLVYPQDKSAIFGDIENYLSDKWGVTI